MRDVLITYNDFARFPELRFVPELRRLTTRCLTARKLWRYQKALHHGLRLMKQADALLFVRMGAAIVSHSHNAETQSGNFHGRVSFAKRSFLSQQRCVNIIFCINICVRFFIIGGITLIAASAAAVFKKFRLPIFKVILFSSNFYLCR